jgi:hypothetical protein
VEHDGQNDLGPILWNNFGRNSLAKLKMVECIFLIVTSCWFEIPWDPRLFIVHNSEWDKLTAVAFGMELCPKFEDIDLSKKFSSDMEFHQIDPRMSRNRNQMSIIL